MTEVTQLPLWEHAATSGRFAEYGVGSAVQPWSLVGKGLLSCLSFLGGVADVAHLGTWSSGAEAQQAVAADGRVSARPASVLGQHPTEPGETGQAL